MTCKNRIELRLVLRKDTVDQRDQLSLEVTGHVDQIEAVPAQLLQRQQTILCNIAFGIAPEADQLGDDEGIFASVLILRMNISRMALVWIGLSRMTW